MLSVLANAAAIVNASVSMDSHHASGQKAALLCLQRCPFWCTQPRSVADERSLGQTMRRGMVDRFVKRMAHANGAGGRLSSTMGILRL